MLNLEGRKASREDRLRDLVADILPVGGNRADLGDLLVGRDLLRLFPKIADDRIHGDINPRFSSIGFRPALTALAPSRTMARASMVAVVVMRGAPNDLSRTTLRPFGPSVTLTGSARMLTPRSIRSRASD
jgi:hypothetical protein